MSDITLRLDKGTPLTNQEVDDNFDNLNADKYESGDSPLFVDIDADTIQLLGGTGTQGTLSWNADEETVDLIQNGATLQLGQEVQIHCRNSTGSTIPDGTPVYATGTIGNSGRITVAPMIADGTVPAKYVIGITTEEILNGEDGKVTTFGKIRNLDTSAYTDGDVLYISPSTAGAFTTTEPSSPDISLPVAFVIHAHANGTLFCRVTPVDENSHLKVTENLADLANAATARTNLGLGTAATTDSTAYATAAQGTLADAALPASSYTAADVLTKVKTVDGAGSGLDADLLDGNHASAFATSAQGSLADSALQSGDNISLLTNDSGYITGNQTITLSGDVSGSGTTSISVTIADDSHNHIISNVDGLQTALDGKVDDSQVLTNVPAGAVFTDTTYSVGNGGLTEINFTSALNSKLAGIESGATADQTASEILTAVKTVDGSGSGLDADLLDGQQGSYYQPASTAWTVMGNSPSDLNNAGQGLWRINASEANRPSGVNYGTLLSFDNTSDTGFQLASDYQGSSFYWRASNAPVYGGGGAFSPWRRIWHDGNDGSGSGLDADLLDGQQGSYYQPASSALKTSTTFGGDVSGTYNAISVNNDSHNHTYFSVTGITDLNSVPSANNNTFRPFIADFQAANRSGSNYNGGFEVGTRASGYGAQFVFEANGATTPPKFRNKTGGTWNSWYSLWHNGNDGSGSGLDADLLDGYHRQQLMPYQSFSDFANGTLVTTDIPASASNGDSFVIEVTGKAYGASRPHSIIAEGYLYNNTVINTNGTNISGSNFTYLKVMNNGGYLSFWWPRHGYWNSYDVYVRSSSGGTSNENRVTSISNSSDPSGATKKVQINLTTSWTSANDGSGSGLDADLLDGQHASAFKPDWYSTWAPVSKSQSVWYQMAYDGCIHVAVDVTVYYDVDIGNNTTTYTRFSYKANAGNGSRASAAIPLAKGQWYRVTPNYSSPVGSIYEQRLRG